MFVQGTALFWLVTGKSHVALALETSAEDWEMWVALNVAPHGGSSGFSFVSEYRGRGPCSIPASMEGDLFLSQRT